MPITQPSPSKFALLSCIEAAVVNDISAGDGVVVAGVAVVERALFLGTNVGTLLVP